jgi:hypothetical protein
MALRELVGMYDSCSDDDPSVREIGSDVDSPPSKKKRTSVEVHRSEKLSFDSVATVMKEIQQGTFLCCSMMCYAWLTVNMILSYWQHYLLFENAKLRNEWLVERLDEWRTRMQSPPSTRTMLIMRVRKNIAVAKFGTCAMGSALPPESRHLDKGTEKIAQSAPKSLRRPVAEMDTAPKVYKWPLGSNNLRQVLVIKCHLVIFLGTLKLDCHLEQRHWSTNTTNCNWGWYYSVHESFGLQIFCSDLEKQTRPQAHQVRKVETRLCKMWLLGPCNEQTVRWNSKRAVSSFSGARVKAKEHPGKYLSVIIDSMDQRKTCSFFLLLLLIWSKNKYFGK